MTSLKQLLWYIYSSLYSLYLPILYERRGKVVLLLPNFFHVTWFLKLVTIIPFLLNLHCLDYVLAERIEQQLINGI
jgi:hypothetical protein